MEEVNRMNLAACCMLIHSFIDSDFCDLRNKEQSLCNLENDEWIQRTVYMSFQLQASCKGTPWDINVVSG